MGNILVDLDATFGKIQFNYYTARNRFDFVEGAQLLYEANASLPTEGCIEDLPKFKVQGNAMKHEHTSNEQALQYCNKYAPLIWRALAIYREDMIQRLGDE